jgi:LDH2 family malate/lactate/ureidoglycolate dehydrogenase
MGRGKITYQALSAYIMQILENLGYSRQQAEVTARVLVEADARGVPSHGIARLSFYESNIRDGFAFPQAPIEIVHETPLSLVVDGHNGIGSCIALFTMTRVIEKAKSMGAGFGAVRNSNHFGMAGLWAEMAAAQGYIGMAFCNTRICSIPTFGRERILGTNPVCFAIPTAGSTHFMLDMATTTVAHGKIEVYERRGKPMPVGWAVDETGADTTDTLHFQKLFRSDTPDGGHLFLGGAGEELGGHKGYGLGLFVDLLCAGMSLGAWSRDTFSPRGAGITHFFGAIRTDLFGNPADIAAHVESILEQVRQSAKAADRERIYIHGEKEAEKRAESMVEGIALDDATWKLLDDYAAKFGLEKLTAPESAVQIAAI